jgi:hypothetical protein
MVHYDYDAVNLPVAPTGLRVKNTKKHVSSFETRRRHTRLISIVEKEPRCVVSIILTPQRSSLVEKDFLY